jgi:hypothetical protein
MPSVLNVDTIADAAGTGAVALTKQSAAKAFVRFNGTGTLAVNKSLNHSSVTDNTTGNYTPNYTNAFSDSNSCVTMSKKNSVSNASFGINNASVATTNYNMQLYENNVATDTDIVSAATLGDLA